MKSFGNLSILLIVLFSTLTAILFSKVECRPTIGELLDVVIFYPLTATARKFILDETTQAIKTTKNIDIIRGPTFGPIYE